MINILYPDLEGPPQELLPGMWMSKHRVPCAVNVGMNLPGYDGLLVLEPPVVRPDLYDQALDSQHRWVFRFNGPEYIYSGIPPLWPEPRPVEVPWEERLDAIAVFPSRKSSNEPGELYSLREFLVGYLSRWKRVDVVQAPFGQAKVEVLSRYRYHLCPENCLMFGYATEKLVDCVAAGCCPIYVGRGYGNIHWENPFEFHTLSDDGARVIAEFNSSMFQALLCRAKTENLWNSIQSTITGER